VKYRNTQDDGIEEISLGLPENEKPGNENHSNYDLDDSTFDL